MISVLVAALLAAAAPADTVYTVDGGRVVGTVLEESPSSGVAIQTADGAVRRIAPAQVLRIEFSDGTASEPRPAPAPAAAPAPAPIHAGPPDTVFFTGGGRVRGTVIQEDPKTGVKMRLLDGSLRTFAPEEYTRIEYADGTVSRRKPAEPAPVAPVAAPPPHQEPATAARAASAEPPVDTIFFVAGGRVRGTVIEENPATGVRIRQLDGSLHTYPRDELVRIEYSDGTVSRRKTPAPAPAPVPVPMAPPPQQAVLPPPPPQPPLVEGRPPIVPFYLTLGVGATFFGGDAERDVRMNQVFMTQGHISSEFGLRLGPSWAIGLYGDAGGGDVEASIRQQCRTRAMDCIGTTERWGVLLRHTWDPASSVAKWLSVGTGWESGGMSDANSNQTADVFTYSGRELLRLGAGIDFRSNQVLGFGFYGSFSWGQYDTYKDANGPVPIDHRTHTTGQVGIRLTLFP